MTKYLYGLTIQGIQSYIFSTNKLKEIIGASEIIEKISTSLLKDILGDDFIVDNLLLNAAGNVKYIFEKKDDAQKVYLEMPQKIIDLAGNISFSQAIIEIEGYVTTDDFVNLEKKLKAKRNKPTNQFETVVMARGVERRTGEPLFLVKKNQDNKEEHQDLTTVKKLKKKDAKLLLNKITEKETKWTFPKEISEISNNKSFVAIIHADGNKLGVTINEILTSETETNILKKMSKQIENSTISAFKEAFQEVIVKDENYFTRKDENDNIEYVAPLRPVILGGDDITLIIRADLAIKFTNVYLKAFEKFTKENFKNIGIDNGLTATAGISFIKEKYPFHYGVHLAESICIYSKNLSRDYSSMKFYKVQDAFVNNYNDIIKSEYSPNGFEFKKDAYTTSEIEELMKNLSEFQKEEVASGSFRELLTIMYQDKTKAEFRWERIKEIQKKAIRESIGLNKDKLEDNKTLYDLITLASLTADN